MFLNLIELMSNVIRYTYTRMKELKETSPKLYKLIKEEEKRQEETIDLIPSENYASKAVMQATGSVLTNKYSEGYPGRRYYPGNIFVDEVEKICQENAKKIFNLGDDWQVNVQPFSGGPANFEIYCALLEPGETILSLKLSHGGHLSHGHKVNVSSKFFNIVNYGLNDSGFIDYDELERLAIESKPKIIVSGATAYSRKIDFKRIGEIAKKVGAHHLADISHIAGLVSAELHESPFGHSDIVMTTTHKTLGGPRSAVIYSRSEIAFKIDKAIFPGLKGGPHEHVILAKAVAFEEALSKKFIKRQKQTIINAKALASKLIGHGLNLVSGGTDNHLILIDLRGIVDASEAEKLLEEANILANRNTIPDDESPFKPSGLRIGTPAMTTRGMTEKEMEQIAFWISQILKKEEVPENIKNQVIKLCKDFPIYEN
jgi:glycine hydroxymethyltransferase